MRKLLFFFLVWAMLGACADNPNSRVEPDPQLLAIADIKNDEVVLRDPDAVYRLTKSDIERRSRDLNRSMDHQFMHAVVKPIRGTDEYMLTVTVLLPDGKSSTQPFENLIRQGDVIYWKTARTKDMASIATCEGNCAGGCTMDKSANQYECYCFGARPNDGSNCFIVWP